MKETSPVIKFDPRALEISDHASHSKVNFLQAFLSNGKNHDPVIVLADNDNTLYVADGNTRAVVAQRLGKPIPGIIVDDDYQLGPQTALERVLGIFFRREGGQII